MTRYRFADGSAVDLSADLPRALAALEAWSPGAGADWVALPGHLRGDVAGVGAVPHRPAAVAAAPAATGRRRPTRATCCACSRGARCATLARAHARDPRLRMVIERFATYAGADPRRAPAALAVAGYVEHAFGAWHLRGGLYELVDAMCARLEALGGELRLGRRSAARAAGARGATGGERTPTRSSGRRRARAPAARPAARPGASARCPASR